MSDKILEVSDLQIRYVTDEETVHLDAVFIGGKMHPFRFYIHHSFPLLQKQNV